MITLKAMNSSTTGDSMNGMTVASMSLTNERGSSLQGVSSSQQRDGSSYPNFYDPIIHAN